MAGILLISVTAIGLVFTPNTSGNPLEQIQQELYGAPQGGSDKRKTRTII